MPPTLDTKHGQSCEVFVVFFKINNLRSKAMEQAPHKDLVILKPIMFITHTN